MSDHKPLFWRPDPLADAQLRLECSIKLHREAGKRGFSCSPKKSYIAHGDSYYAEINEFVPSGRIVDGIPSYIMRPNVAMGTGPTPLEAAVDGYRKAGLLDDMMLALYLECELHMLGETIRVFGRLDATLAELNESLEMLAA